MKLVYFTVNKEFNGSHRYHGILNIVQDTFNFKQIHVTATKGYVTVCSTPRIRSFRIIDIPYSTCLSRLRSNIRRKLASVLSFYKWHEFMFFLVLMNFTTKPIFFLPHTPSLLLPRPHCCFFSRPRAIFQGSVVISFSHGSMFCSPNCSFEKR